MHKSSPFLKKLHPHPKYIKRRKTLFGVGVHYLLILFFIYPLSAFSFNTFLNFREPVFLLPIFAEEISIRSDTFGHGHFAAARGGGMRKHKGLDIKANIGEAVRASKSGAVKIGWVRSGMGKYVKIKHREAYSTMYGHLSKITVKNNQWVWQGEQIGKVGKTGNANYKGIQPHLHFEIKYKNRYIDPLKLLRSNRKRSK